jgi:hypothetical protein
MYIAQWAREFNLELSWERATINDATAPTGSNLFNAKTEKWQLVTPYSVLESAASHTPSGLHEESTGML